MDTDSSGTLLIVDDTPANLGMLFDFLSDAGFKVLVAKSGESAIQKAEYALPDLILLDVMMSGIDGFETCDRLKASDATKDIPVIFMTALTEIVNKVKGFNLGAVDYITKPIEPEEALSRIQLHLNLKNMTQKLQQQNLQLQQEIQERAKAEAALCQARNQLEIQVQERTAELSQTNQQLKQEIRERQQIEQALRQSESQLRSKAEQLELSLHQLKQTQAQLVQTEKVSSLGQLVAGIAHEVNNPVGFIAVNLHHAEGYAKDLFEHLSLYQQQFPHPSAEIEAHSETIELEYLQEDLPKMLSSMKVGVDRIRDIMASLRTFLRLDEAEKKSVNIHEGIDSTLMILHHRLKANAGRSKIEIIKNYGELPLVECYAGQLNQVFMNLLSNAIDALDTGVGCQILPRDGASPPIPSIHICTKLIDSQQVAISIEDNGSGIPEEMQQRLFEPFFTTKSAGKGTGLGLSISHQIVTEKHGGMLQCFSFPGQGTRFVIQIPLGNF